jgi:hypothetical protein
MTQRLVLTLLACSFCITGIFAQEEGGDFLRETGKIYVVVAVLATILIILLIYLAVIDRKVRKIENRLNNGDNHQA